MTRGMRETVGVESSGSGLEIRVPIYFSSELSLVVVPHLRAPKRAKGDRCDSGDSGDQDNLSDSADLGEKGEFGDLGDYSDKGDTVNRGDQGMQGD